MGILSVPSWESHIVCNNVTQINVFLSLIRYTDIFFENKSSVMSQTMIIRNKMSKLFYILIIFLLQQFSFSMTNFTMLLPLRVPTEILIS